MSYYEEMLRRLDADERLRNAENIARLKAQGGTLPKWEREMLFEKVQAMLDKLESRLRADLYADLGLELPPHLEADAGAELPALPPHSSA